MVFGIKEFNFKRKQEMVENILLVDAVPYLDVNHQRSYNVAAFPVALYHRNL